MKVATLMDVFHCGGDIDPVQSVEESEGLEGTVDASGIAVGVNRVASKRPCFRIL